MQTWRQRQAGDAASYRRDRHSIEDIVESLELEAAAGSLGNDPNSGVTKNWLEILNKTLEPDRAKMALALHVVGHPTDDPQLHLVFVEELVGDRDEFDQVHLLRQPDGVTQDQCAARYRA